MGGHAARSRSRACDKAAAVISGGALGSASSRAAVQPPAGSGVLGWCRGHRVAPWPSSQGSVARGTARAISRAIPLAACPAGRGLPSSVPAVPSWMRAGAWWCCSLPPPLRAQASSGATTTTLQMSETPGDTRWVSPPGPKVRGRQRLFPHTVTPNLAAVAGTSAAGTEV